MNGSGGANIFLLRNPITYDVGETLSTYSYTMGLSQGRYSFASAIGLFTSVVNITLLMMANWVSRKVTDMSPVEDVIRNI